MAGLKFQISTLDPLPYSVVRARVGAVGVLTTQVDDILGRGEREALPSAQKYSERRLGDLEVAQERLSPVRMAFAEAADFSAHSRARPTRCRLRPSCGCRRGGTRLRQ